MAEEALQGVPRRVLASGLPLRARVYLPDPLKLFTLNLVTTALFLSGASVIGSPLHFPFSQALMLAKPSMSSLLGG